MEVKLGNWSEDNKSYREVLVNGRYIGEVTKTYIYSVHLEYGVKEATYKDNALILAEAVKEHVESKYLYYKSIFERLKE